MAIIQTRQELKDYCLRKLGYPVIEINVDDAQIEDRLDDALLLFSEMHYDGTERVFLPKQLTQTDIDQQYIDLEAPTVADPSKNIVAAPAMDPDGNSILSVVRVFQMFNTLGGSAGVNIFDAKYQIALSDLFGLYSSTGSGFTMGSIQHYDITRRHLGLLQDYLTPEKAVRFSKVTNKIYLDAAWKDYQPGDWLMFEAYKILDAERYPEIYNDRILKAYTTALIKKQWGSNLSKYNGISLAGGVTLNGSQIFTEAIQEIDLLEKEMASRYELPPDFMVG
jgi:hypothetical protein